MKRNLNFDKVSSRYLFQEIRARCNTFKKEHPDAALISCGIGDTTEPVGPFITQELLKASKELGTRDGYSGYGPEQGIPELREAISDKIYQGRVAADEIFISDGAKCDLGRLQYLFGHDAKIALQDPTYPVYLDSSVIYRGECCKFLACTPENGFLPNLEEAKDCDVLFLCLPNNPTGTIFTRQQLVDIVNFAKRHKITIIFDTAYSFYVQDGYPKSIYEIDGADEVAIELGSFSKIAGFSGVRLGWTVVPEKLKYKDGTKVKPDWMRINATFFNGASIISQKGGIAVLSPQGLSEVQAQVEFYLENTKMLASCLSNLGFKTYGATHSPYVWVKMQDMTSWQAFDLLLNTAQIVTTPGSGFGKSGEGFLRLSGFGSRASVIEACKRMHATITTLSCS